MAGESRTRFIILAFLHCKPGSGYSIKKAIENSVANFWRESYGQIYPKLNEMEHDGLVKLQSKDNSHQARSNVYEITEKGKDVLLNWLSTEAGQTPPRSEMLLKLFFGDLVGPSVMRNTVFQYRSRKENELRRLQSILEQFSEKPDGHAVYAKMTVEYGIQVSTAVIEWCNETLEILEGQL